MQIQKQVGIYRDDREREITTGQTPIQQEIISSASNLNNLSTDKNEELLPEEFPSSAGKIMDVLTRVLFANYIHNRVQFNTSNFVLLIVVLNWANEWLVPPRKFRLFLTISLLQKSLKEIKNPRLCILFLEPACISQNCSNCRRIKVHKK